MTGTPVSAAIRIQFNLEVKPIKDVDMMATLPELLFPMFWIEESFQMNRELTDPIKDGIYRYKFRHFFALNKS